MGRLSGLHFDYEANKVEREGLDFQAGIRVKQCEVFGGLTCWYSIFLTQTVLPLSTSALSFSSTFLFSFSSCLTLNPSPFESGELAMTLCLLLRLLPPHPPCLGSPQLLLVHQQHLPLTHLSSSPQQSHLQIVTFRGTKYPMRPASLSAGTRTFHSYFRSYSDYSFSVSPQTSTMQS